MLTLIEKIMNGNVFKSQSKNSIKVKFYHAMDQPLFLDPEKYSTWESVLNFTLLHLGIPLCGAAFFGLRNENSYLPLWKRSYATHIFLSFRMALYHFKQLHTEPFLIDTIGLVGLTYIVEEMIRTSRNPSNSWNCAFVSFVKLKQLEHKNEDIGTEQIWTEVWPKLKVFFQKGRTIGSSLKTIRSDCQRLLPNAQKKLLWNILIDWFDDDKDIKNHFKLPEFSIKSMKSINSKVYSCSLDGLCQNDKADIRWQQVKSISLKNMVILLHLESIEKEFQIACKSVKQAEEFFEEIRAVYQCVTWGSCHATIGDDVSVEVMASKLHRIWGFYYFIDDLDSLLKDRCQYLLKAPNSPSSECHVTLHRLGTETPLTLDLTTGHLLTSDSKRIENRLKLERDVIASNIPLQHLEPENLFQTNVPLTFDKSLFKDWIPTKTESVMVCRDGETTINLPKKFSGPRLFVILRSVGVLDTSEKAKKCQDAFSRNMRKTLTWTHPHLVQVAGLVMPSLRGPGQEEQWVMEHWTGDLHDLFWKFEERKQFNITIKWILELGRDLAKALHYLHDFHGSYHGNITPSNIVVVQDHRKQWVAKLADAGCHDRNEIQSSTCPQVSDVRQLCRLVWLCFLYSPHATLSARHPPTPHLPPITPHLPHSVMGLHAHFSTCSDLNSSTNCMTAKQTVHFFSSLLTYLTPDVLNFVMMHFDKPINEPLTGDRIPRQLRDCETYNDKSKWKALGEGHYAKVFCHKTERVAMKQLKSYDINEAIIQFELDHPNIIKILKVDPETNILVMELAGRGDIDQLKKTKGLEIDQIMSYLTQICDAMVYLFHERIVHRDVACRNILVMNNDLKHVKLGDFGLARRLVNGIYEGDKESVDQYRLPPNDVKTDTYNDKTDVWSFGIVCYEIYSDKKNEVKGVSEKLQSGKRVQFYPSSECLENLANRCWKLNSCDRISFNQIQTLLKHEKNN